MGKPTDFELLDAWRAGDTDAGDELVRRNFDSVSRYLRGKLAPDAVQDLIQATFLACVERVERIATRVSFRAYVLGIARNLLGQHYRKAGRRAGVAAKGFEQLTVEEVMGPSKVVAARDEERILLMALRRIPFDFQTALEMFFWEQMSHAEIAVVLDVAVGTVKSRIHRGKTMLREQIELLAEAKTLPEATLDDLDSWARSVAPPREDGD